MSEALADGVPDASRPDGTILTIDDLVVEFPLGARTVRAVDGLSLTIEAGSVSASSESRGPGSRR